MTHHAQPSGLRFLVVHHDLIVMDDLCETLAQTARPAVIDRATGLSPSDIAEKSYDAALIEASRNASAFEGASRSLSRRLERVVWITDDMNPTPELPPLRASLRQPFRTEDVMAALLAAGLSAPGRASPKA